MAFPHCESSCGSWHCLTAKTFCCRCHSGKVFHHCGSGSGQSGWLPARRTCCTRSTCRDARPSGSSCGSSGCSVLRTLSYIKQVSQRTLIYFVSGSITVQLTSCLFCLDSAALLMLISNIFTCLVQSKPVKQEVRPTQWYFPLRSKWVFSELVFHLGHLDQML